MVAAQGLRDYREIPLQLATPWKPLNSIARALCREHGDVRERLWLEEFPGHAEDIVEPGLAAYIEQIA